MRTCLGCGGSVCRVCEDKTTALTALSHWPLEVNISRAALEHMQRAITSHLDCSRGDSETDVAGAVYAELANLANIIRAHLQHEPAPAALPTDWLDA